MKRGDWVTVKGQEHRGEARIVEANRFRVTVRWPLNPERGDGSYPRTHVEVAASPFRERDAST